MNALSDPQLLRAYAESRSETAFAELVRRHIDFVHSAAFRMVNDPHLAKDITQGVFVALAKDAGKLTVHPVLSGWLHRTARNIAAQTFRTEVRRRNREKEAAAMNESLESDAAWEEIAPHLDAALAELSEPDRDAVLLRYFENKPAQEMAAILGISAEAAQKRVSRAVERLRENFAKRGVTAGAAGLAGVISSNAVQAAPMGLAATISSATIAGTVTTAKILAMTAIQKSLLTVVAVLVGALIYKSHQSSEATNEIARLREEVRNFRKSGETGAQNQQRSEVSGGKPDDSRAAFAGVASGGGDKEVYTGEHEPAINYIVSGGTLSSSLMTKFGLSREQFIKTQGVVGSHWGAMAAWAAKSIFYDDASSKVATDGANIYRLPAMDPSERQAMLNKFSQDLQFTSNSAAAGAILAGLSDDQSFAYMGKYEVVFRFTEKLVQILEWNGKTNAAIAPPSVMPNDARVDYSYIDPKSGRMALSTEGSDIADTNKMFGNIFQPEN